MANPFSGFFDNLVSGALSPKGNLADYQHASRIYVDGNMRLAPKLPHLFHVVLNIDPTIPISTNDAINNSIKREINVLCKSVDLPNYNVDVQVLNQYNRKKVHQTSVNYAPVNMTWHDDNAGLTNFLWKSYFNYYYSDASHTETNSTSPAILDPALLRINNKNNSYSNGENFDYRYGLDRPGKSNNFFTSIQVFQLHPENGTPTNTSFTYFNPLIETWNHNSVDIQGGQFKENTMRFSYESVVMDRHVTNVGVTPKTFGEGRYDSVASPLTVSSGGGSSFFGTGGVLAGTESTLNQLQQGNVLGALITGANTFQNAQNLSFAGLITELAGGLENVAVNSINNTNFPSSSNQNVTEAQAKNFGS